MAFGPPGAITEDQTMTRPREREANGSPAMISIIGPGMQVVGDCVTEGTLRVEGSLLR